VQEKERRWKMSREGVFHSDVASTQVASCVHSPFAFGNFNQLNKPPSDFSSLPQSFAKKGMKLN